MSINSGVLKREMKICYDEWNVWDETKAPGSVGLEQSYEYVDMLGVCAWLNVLVRKSKDVGIACIAQSVNVVSVALDLGHSIADKGADYGSPGVV